MTMSAKPAVYDPPPNPWWLLLIEAIAAIIIGLLLLISPVSTLLVLVRLLGFYFLITGVLSIIGIFIDSTSWGWKLLSGILGILAGIVIIEHPLWSTLIVPATFVWVLAAIMIITGVISLIMAFQGAGWGRGVLGVLGILLGIALLARTLLAALSLPLVLGILAVVGGVLVLFDAFRLRRLASDQSEIKPDVPSTTDDRGIPATAVQPAAVKTAAEPTDPDLEFLGLGDAGELDKFKQSLVYIEGIGPAYAKKLSVIGIQSPLDLLRQGALPQGRKEISKKTEISGLLILEWINHIDLFRIRGVGSEYADLLEESGVDTVMELAHRNPQNLYEKMQSVNAVKNLVRKLPAQNQVVDWIAQAKELPRVIEY
jgi:uncharacterized membrane protein HdeD (DUF308 family)/predicted flap endonuclease-1-like 5' DNA nuclease